ncbi:putative necrosis-inducing factor-domain-containing protein [Podospora didyma]|uniref:Necrosis-inducing factor-domain-containing protein n=1 Tax=Podospora didyma TaxID=330526 RepID=A0AAE0KEJ6_9PEZI|nr:putative necrosis-inducing factor-domain-containing protein [Podospora didyma]
MKNTTQQLTAKFAVLIGAIILAQFVSSIHALPASSSPTAALPALGMAPPGGVSQKHKSVNDCGSSTLINRFSMASPKTEDCAALKKSMEQDDSDGTWIVWSDTQHTLATHGLCAFGVTMSNAAFAWIGNQDAILIDESIRTYGWNDHMGTEGDMWCQGDAGASVNWGVYHTD